MPIDHELLRSLSSFEDEELGIRERFLTPDLEGTPSVAVLSTPLSAARPVAWLMCGSFGPEESALSPLRVELARALSIAGFPVLRYQSRGYGDSQDGGTILPGPGSQIADAVTAARVLREAAGVGSIGIIGARFGGAVAALAATPAGADLAVLIQPVTHGRPYFRSIVVRALAVDARTGTPARATDEDGLLDLDGFAVPPQVAQELDVLDVVTASAAFEGRAVIIEVTRKAETEPALIRFGLALGSADGRCAIERIVHPDAHRFGLPRIRKLPGRGKSDVQRDLSDLVTARVVECCSRLVDELDRVPVSA